MGSLGEAAALCARAKIIPIRMRARNFHFRLRPALGPSRVAPKAILKNEFNVLDGRPHDEALIAESGDVGLKCCPSGKYQLLRFWTKRYVFRTDLSVFCKKPHLNLRVAGESARELFLPVCLPTQREDSQRKTHSLRRRISSYCSRSSRSVARPTFPAFAEKVI